LSARGHALRAPGTVLARRAMRRLTAPDAGRETAPSRGGPVLRRPSRALVTFPNPAPDRDYLIRHVCPEYSAVCPVTGQPDFGTIVVRYVPDRLCVELKSLKLYLWSFRDEGHYFEQVTNQIRDDLVAALAPRRLSVVGRFNVRGGIASTVVAHYRAARAGARTRVRSGAGARGRAGAGGGRTPVRRRGS
jgi:7-cyano-7-deazaguanine reductase